MLRWDGLGLVSWLMVIYYQNVRSYGAGILTVLSNQIMCVVLNKAALLDFIYTNQCTFYTQMYQSFEYILKSLKTF